MSGVLPPLPADWLATLQARLVQPPPRPRAGLWWQDAEIGSVEPGWIARVHAASPATRASLQPFEQGFRIDAPVLTTALAQLAHALRDAGLAHVWRMSGAMSSCR